MKHAGTCSSAITVIAQHVQRLTYPMLWQRFDYPLTKYSCLKCNLSLLPYYRNSPALPYETCCLNLVWQASPFTRGRRKGLVSCLYASCTCCSQECSPIRLLHVITNVVGLSQTHELTNQVPDLLIH